jgi:hypothetical protein
MIKKRQYNFSEDTHEKLILLAKSQRRNLSSCLAYLIEEAYKNLELETENAKN